MKRRQQQYIQGFSEKKPCQRQVDTVQCSAGQNQSSQQGQVGQQISKSEPATEGQWGLHQPSICSNGWKSEHDIFLQKLH